MIPADAIQKIRSVTIQQNHLHDCIRAFSFFDKDGALLWEIGDIQDAEWISKKTVLLKVNEKIIGVVAKKYPGWQSIYIDFQFQIALE